ncbi:hypothetical protein Tco_1214594 [Tanacetum coccineum]
MAALKFVDSHNMVAFLEKPTESDRFEKIVNFLNAHTIKYALTVNPIIYTSCIEQFWVTAKAKTVNGEEQLQALVDRKKVIITESTIRRGLQLEDAEGKKQPRRKQRQDTKVPQPSNPITNVVKEDVNEEQVPTHFNDPLLSGEDRVKLEELMDLCTNLQNRVLALETTKTAQAQEITSLEKRVKKLDRRKKSRTYRLKRLYKERKIHDIDADEDITLENIHDTDMFRVHDLDGDEAFVKNLDASAGEKVEQSEKVVETKVAAAKDVNLSVDEVTLTQALTVLRNAKPKATTTPTVTTTTTTVTTAATITTIAVTRPNAKELVIQEREEQEQAFIVITSSKDKGKGIMVKEPLKMKKKDQDKVEIDYELAQRLQEKEQEELIIEEKSKLFVLLLEKRRKHFAAKRAEEKRNRPPIKS